MNIRQGTGLRLRGTCLAIGAALALSSPAHAVTFEWGNWSGSWDNTVSYGISVRAEDSDPRLIGRGNGGTGYIGADDDGNLNFDSGDIFSNIIKGTSEMGVDNGQFGAFGRIKYWYDFELANGGRAAPHVERVGPGVVGDGPLVSAKPDGSTDSFAAGGSGGRSAG